MVRHQETAHTFTLLSISYIDKRKFQKGEDGNVCFLRRGI